MTQIRSGCIPSLQTCMMHVFSFGAGRGEIPVNNHLLRSTVVSRGSPESQGKSAASLQLDRFVWPGEEGRGWSIHLVHGVMVNVICQLWSSGFMFMSTIIWSNRTPTAKTSGVRTCLSGNITVSVRSTAIYIYNIYITYIPELHINCMFSDRDSIMKYGVRIQSWAWQYWQLYSVQTIHQMQFGSTANMIDDRNSGRSTDTKTNTELVHDYDVFVQAQSESLGSWSSSDYWGHYWAGRGDLHTTH